MTSVACKLVRLEVTSYETGEVTNGRGKDRGRMGRGSRRDDASRFAKCCCASKLNTPRTHLCVLLTQLDTSDRVAVHTVEITRFSSSSSKHSCLSLSFIFFISRARVRARARVCVCVWVSEREGGRKECDKCRDNLSTMLISIVTL